MDNEDQPNPFQGGSTFHITGEGWYAETTRGVRGPFPSRELAQAMADRPPAPSVEPTAPADPTRKKAGAPARFSAERFFHIANEGWYYNSREGVKGPFNTREAAERDLDQIVRNSTKRRRMVW